ncbi:MAG: GntR family transcriptional regulator [Trueperaceae bacterium]|nr:GntR family transcriptional regulator [Trueperaceae bacterium]
MRREQGPIYVRIESDLRRSIATGEWGLGSRIPTEAALKERYGVSRMTVRHAVDRLATAGLLVRRQGVGTFVAKTKIERVTSRLLGFREDALAHGLDPATRVLRSGSVAADDELAVLLDVAIGEALHEVVRVRSTGGEPIGLNTVILLPHVARALGRFDYTESLYDGVARALGAEVTSAGQTIEAVATDADTSTHLRLPVGSPLLRVTRVTYVADGRLIGLTRTLYRGDRYYLSLEVRRSEPEMPG